MKTENAKAAAPTAGTEAPRALALDALRGIAILAMVLSALIPGPYGGLTLPPWMYHYQDVLPGAPGISWVDLVFPWFLFAMGAAIPIALSNRLAKGAHRRALALGVLQRGALLAFFSLYAAHTRLFTLAPDGGVKPALLSLFSFAVALVIFARYPKTWPPNLKVAMQTVGWIAATTLLLALRMPDGASLLGNSAQVNAWLNGMDIIIMVLANVYVVGSFIWLFTRDSLPTRLAPLGILLALKLSSTVTGEWAQQVWNWSPFPWLYRMEFLKYLFIVVPATVVGDYIVQWLRKPAAEPSRWPASRLWLLAAVTLIPVPVILWGTVAREVVPAAVVTVALLASGLYLTRQPKTPTERFLHSTLSWGAYWLVVGLILEPFEGGVKKTPSTFAYYFIPGGLAAVAMVGLTVIIDVLKKPAVLSLMVANGQNAMLAYIGNTNLLAPAMALVSSGLVAAGQRSIGRRMQLVAETTGTLWYGVLWAVAQTLLLALVVAWFTRRKVYLRA